MRQSPYPPSVPGPFLNDPDTVVREHLSRAVGTPMGQVAAIHIDLALHHAAVARASGLVAQRATERRP